MDKLLTVLFFSVAVIMLSTQAQKSVSRTKRSEDAKSCFVVLSSCRQNSTCGSAYRTVKKRCTISSGKCTAKDTDLQKCSDNIEILQATYFRTLPRCDCFHLSLPLKKLQKCLENIFNLVYSNPCYDAGMEIRNRRILEAASKSQNETSSPTTILPNKTTPDVAQQTRAASNPDKEKLEMKPDDKEEKQEDDELTEKELEELDQLFAETEVRPQKRPIIIPPTKFYPPSVVPSSPTTISSPSTTTTTLAKKTTTKMITRSTKVSNLFGNETRSLSSIEIALIVLGILTCLSAIIGVNFYVKRRRHSVRYVGAKNTTTNSSIITYTENEQKPSENTSVS